MAVSSFNVVFNDVNNIPRSTRFACRSPTDSIRSIMTLVLQPSRYTLGRGFRVEVGRKGVELHLGFEQQNKIRFTLKWNEFDSSNIIIDCLKELERVTLKLGGGYLPTRWCAFTGH